MVYVCEIVMVVLLCFFLGGGVLFTFSDEIEWRILLQIRFC